jgi:sugar lactone lactonase YvrE
MNVKSFKILMTMFTLGICCSFVIVYLNTKISFQADNLYPEGITYDSKRDLFYVSSIASGKIGAVDRKGNFKVACDDSRLVSTLGLKYDSRNDKLYALNGDFGMSSKSNPQNAGKIAQLAIINVTSSTVEDIVDLSGLTSSAKRLANDLTVDNEGNIYVTDSYASVIYKVDKNKKASVFAQSDLFKPDSNSVGLNGIAYSKEGYLIVAKTGEGSLLKISIKNPAQVEKVKLPEAMLWIDGIYFINDKELVVVRNRFQKTVFLSSKDQWKSGDIVKEEKSSDQMPTTASGYKNEVFVINSRMMDMREKKDNKTFVIDIYTK